MLTELRNTFLSLKVAAKGAEMQSVYDLRREREVLWQGNDTFWGRRAPVLFPIVGRLKGDEYIYEGKKYKMSQHGFARDKTFELVSREDNELHFQLSEDDETLYIYPFPFRLTISYRLQDNKVIITYRVKNTGDRLMPFSIGGHPAFNCPLNKAIHFEDYDILFAKKESLSRRLLIEGIRTQFEALNLKEGIRYSLSYKDFERDAVIIEALESSSVSLAYGSEKEITVHFPDFGQLGLWTKPGAHFICIEPWNGLADPENTNREIMTKENIILLKAGDTKSYSYSIRIH